MHIFICIPSLVLIFLRHNIVENPSLVCPFLSALTVLQRRPTTSGRREFIFLQWPPRRISLIDYCSREAGSGTEAFFEFWVAICPPDSRRRGTKKSCIKSVFQKRRIWQLTALQVVTDRDTGPGHWSASCAALVSQLPVVTHQSKRLQSTCSLRERGE